MISYSAIKYRIELKVIVLAMEFQKLGVSR